MSKASKQNPLLEPFRVLIGDWEATGHHPMLPGQTLTGKTSFAWMENGAFLMMRSHMDHKDIPDGIAVFGTDDSRGECMMVYFDERNVSRHYRVMLKGNTWTWWRDDEKFSQRFTAEISPDGNTIVIHGEMSREGGEWEKDLALTYRKM